MIKHMDCNKNLFSRANFVLTTHYSFLDELFSYFGAKALSSCSQVCKLWNKISQKEFKRRKNWEVFMQQSEQRKNSFPSFCDSFKLYINQDLQVFPSYILCFTFCNPFHALKISKCIPKNCTLLTREVDCVIGKSIHNPTLSYVNTHPCFKASLLFLKTSAEFQVSPITITADVWEKLEKQKLSFSTCFNLDQSSLPGALVMLFPHHTISKNLNVVARSIKKDCVKSSFLMVGSYCLGRQSSIVHGVVLSGASLKYCYMIQCNENQKLLHQNFNEIKIRVANTKSNWKDFLMLIFSCVGRQEEAKIECDLVNKMFPGVQVFGCLGQGEILIDGSKKSNKWKARHSYTSFINTLIMSLPPEKVAELKQVIQSHLNQLDIHGQMRNVLSESLRQNNVDGTHDQDKSMIQILKNHGIVDDIMKTLKFNSNEGKKESDRAWLPDEHNKFPVDPEKRYLYFQLLGGKAFLEHLQDPEDIPGNIASTFTIHVHFNGQRYSSKAVSCACEPAFEEGFLMEFKKNTSSYDKIQEAPSLLLNTDKIHLVLIKHDPTGEVHLISSHHMEWRGILCSSSGRVRNSIEMNGVATESKIPVGVLDIRMDLIPRLQQIISTDVMTTQMNLERSRLAERERLFLCYSKQWWREYLQIRSSHSNRLVKIFAQDENSIHRLVCSYVKPLRSGRLLDTPRQAARFVSLLAYQNYPSMSGGSHEMWTTRHCFLSRGKGDVEDHSVLLCSLLLGFGLNAFVCIGTKKHNSPYSWVVTIATDGTILFWDSLTAQRYLHKSIDPNEPPNVLPIKPEHPFITIGCLFNHESFYANSQATDAINTCSFDILNQAHWKSMSIDAIKSVCGRGLMPDVAPLVHLIPSSVDAVFKSNEMENELRAFVFQHRNDLGLTTQWDDELSYLLSPALAAYEFEQSNGVTMGNDDFQHAIRRNVPDGHTFKGFPIQFIHMNTRKAFSTCLKASTCNDIICCRGDQVKLALRVRVFPYPERTCAVWMMFAVKYKSVL